MTNLIEKHPHELKAGDIVNYVSGSCIIVKVRNFGAEGSAEAYVVEMNKISPKVKVMVFTGTCCVSAPTLSPAQQYAEELLHDVKVFLDCDKKSERPFRSFIEGAEILVAKIDPPQPPTLEEALKLLERAGRRVTSDPGFSKSEIDAILDRARRSGVLK